MFFSKKKEKESLFLPLRKIILSGKKTVEHVYHEWCSLKYLFQVISNSGLGKTRTHTMQVIF